MHRHRIRLRKFMLMLWYDKRYFVFERTNRYCFVQVALKIIKHAHEETIEAAQGGLLGLVKDSTLEITNCFPFPNQNKPENADLG